MKTTLVSIAPSERAQNAGRPGLSPELLAATGARYSRNNEGLEAILKRVDPDDEDRSIEAIFRFVDYGHQSIGDMAPVAIFIDGLSILLAFYVWNWCPTASGQESSTRYLRMGDLPNPDDLGIPPEEQGAWSALMQSGFDAYARMLDLWTELSERRPELSRIPAALLADSSEKAQKQVQRMRRNFAFDRARVFLPAAGLTNMMLVMPATGWVRLCSILLSHPMHEANRLGSALRSELELTVPHLIRHIAARGNMAGDFADDLDEAAVEAAESRDLLAGKVMHEKPVEASLDVWVPSGIRPAVAFPRALRHHDNRYAPVGSALRKTSVCYRWNAVGLAEIRDLNRHRTGTRQAGLVPVGFHAALDQAESAGYDESLSVLQNTLLILQDEVGGAALRHARRALCQRRADAPYWHLLGTQFPFSHSTTADKYLYEAELRTGTGAHSRCARRNPFRAAMSCARAAGQSFPRTCPARSGRTTSNN